MFSGGQENVAIGFREICGASEELFVISLE
jgi:hypothetical protein